MWDIIGFIVLSLAAIREGIKGNIFWCALYSFFAIFYGFKLIRRIKQDKAKS